MTFSDAPARPSVRFRRPDAKREVSNRVRRQPARLTQLLALFAAAGALFLAVTGVLHLALSSKGLEVKAVRVRSSDPSVGAVAERMAAGMAWGNIFLLDILDVKKRFEADPRIREARVRKILPASVEVEIEPRVPIAILAKDPPVLVDAEGVEIGPADAGAEPGLPRFEDADGFARDAGDKFKLGWSCLRELSAGDRADVEALDLTGMASVVVKLRSDPVRLRLGETGFSAKIGIFRERRDSWERKFGPLESLDFRFQDRIFVKPAAAPVPLAGEIGTAAKETH